MVMSVVTTGGNNRFRVKSFVKALIFYSGFVLL